MATPASSVGSSLLWDVTNSASQPFTYGSHCAGPAGPISRAARNVYYVRSQFAVVDRWGWIDQGGA